MVNAEDRIQESCGTEDEAAMRSQTIPKQHPGINIKRLQIYTANMILEWALLDAMEAERRDGVRITIKAQGSNTPFTADHLYAATCKSHCHTTEQKKH